MQGDPPKVMLNSMCAFLHTSCLRFQTGFSQDLLNTCLQCPGNQKGPCLEYKIPSMCRTSTHFGGSSDPSLWLLAWAQYCQWFSNYLTVGPFFKYWDPPWFSRIFLTTLKETILICNFNQIHKHLSPYIRHACKLQKFQVLTRQLIARVSGFLTASRLKPVS